MVPLQTERNQWLEARAGSVVAARSRCPTLGMDRKASGAVLRNIYVSC